MKELILVFSLFWIYQVNSLTVNKVDVVEGTVEATQLDSRGNIYVAAYKVGENHQIYKISTEKELLWNFTLPQSVTIVKNLHVTTNNDVYLHLGERLTQYFAILKNNSTAIQKIEETEYDFFFKDGNDNLFYNAESGVRVFKPNATDSVAIKNIEGLKMTRNDQITLDNFGNCYTGIQDYVFVVTQESLQEEFPSARILQVSEDVQDSLHYLYFDEKNDLWMTLSNFNNEVGTVKKFENNATLKTVITDKLHWIFTLVLTKQNVFVIAADYINQGTTSDIYYLTKENQVVEIPELKSITAYYKSTGGMADGDGNAYFFTGEKFSQSLGSMFLVTSEEMKPVPIDLGLKDVEIVFLILDFNEDVWIGTANQGLHYLKKGEVVTEKVEMRENCNFYYGMDSPLLMSWSTKEVYVGCTDGLYVVKT